MQGIAIREAKKLGFFVIAVDGNPHAVCAEEADRFEPIDLKDIAALVSFAKDIQKTIGLDGVFTAATDFSYSVAKIAEACGLKNHSVAACENATNKYRMRTCFKNAGLNSLPFFKVTNESIADLEENLRKHHFDFPLVVKPVDNMGARGCVKLRSVSELKEAVKKALQYSKSGTAIVEAFIAGKEYSTEGFIIDGKFYMTAIADRHIYFPPYFVEMGHTIPAQITEAETAELSRVFEAGARALGLDYGVCKGDIFLSGGKTYIGEIAARLSGGYMSGWTVPYSSGLNVTRLALKLAVGESAGVIEYLENIRLPPTEKNTKRFCAERAWISIPGRVRTVYGLKRAEKSKGVKNVFPRALAGDAVSFPTNNVEKCGNILAIAPTYREAADRAEKAARKIVLRLEPINMHSELFLHAAFVKDFSALQTTKTFCNTLKAQLSYQDEVTFYEYKILPNFFTVKKKLLKKLYKKVDNGTCIKKIKNKNIPNTQNENKLKIIFPECFYPYLKSVFDVQGRSLLHSLKMLFALDSKLFNFLLQHKKTILWKRFWGSFLRGGIQGALYVYDSEK